MNLLKVKLVGFFFFIGLTIARPMGTPETAISVYEDLIQAIGNRITAPRLEVIPEAEAESQAQYYPAYNVIAISESLLEFAKKHEEQESTILALILGHELAHHYGKHSIRSAFAANSTNTARANLEAEADYFAIFFAYLAGYPTDALETDFLKDFYTTFEIDKTNNSHYPTLEKRITIYQEARQTINELAKVFQAGNQLLLIDEFTAAAKCFEFIATKFNSPEILNNAGVAHLQAATTLFSTEEFPFSLPYELEEVSNLSLRNGLRNDQLSQEERIQKRQAHLDLAIANFREALVFKLDYSTAQINLTNALLLQAIDAENRDIIEFQLKQQIDFLTFQATKHTSSVFAAKVTLIKGLSHFLSNQEEQMVKAFEKACAMNKDGLGCWNLQQWQDKTKPYTQTDEGCVSGEGIANRVLVLPATRTKLDQVFSKETPIVLNGYTQQLTISQLNHKDHSSWRIEWMDYQTEEPTFKKIYFLATTSQYQGKNCRDIGLGSKSDLIQKKYGSPFQIKNSRQRQFHRYKNGSVLFGFNDGKVTQMITYYID